MNKKTSKEYFKHLCKAYWIAIKEQKRLEKKWKETQEIEVFKEQDFWRDNISDLLRKVNRAIIEADKKGYVFTITEKEEVFCMIHFLGTCTYPERFKVIDLSEKALKNYPSTNKWCGDFYIAYCLEDYEAIKKLYKKLF